MSARKPIEIPVCVFVEDETFMPMRGSGGAAGYDLRARLDAPLQIKAGDPATLIPTGVRLDMRLRPDLCAVVLPRSGLGHKKGLVLGNGVGLIDSDYTGEIMVSALNRNPQFTYIVAGGKVAGPSVIVDPGDRIAQLVFLPAMHPELVRVEEISEELGERGAGGFGSTGAA